jgi:outer membrane protein TolC
VSLAASASHTELIPEDQGGAGADTSRTYSLGASVSWVVFDGYLRRFQVAAAEAARQGQEDGLRNVQRLLVQGVSLAFFNALLAQDQVVIADQDTAFNRELAEETRKRFEAGASAKSDVLNFEVRAAEAESGRLIAQYNREVAGIVLAQLLGLVERGLPDGTVLVGGGEVPAALDVAPMADDIAYALAHRPDLHAIEMAAAAAQAGAQAAKADLWPTISLTGSYGYVRESSPWFNEDRDASSSMGVSAKWTLYSGGSTRQAVREAEANADEAMADLAEQRLSVVSEVRQQRTAIETAFRQAALRERIHDMTVEMRDLVRKQYTAGTASLTRLNEAQTDLVRAEGNLALARTRYWQFVEDLRAATGRNLVGIGGR